MINGTKGRALALAAAIAILVAGCGTDADTGATDETAAETGAATETEAESADITLLNSGKLTVCTHLPYEPFQFQDESGEIVGFDVDLLDLLAQDLGVEIEVLDIEWEQITSGAVFAADRCDVGMGAATITEERQDAVLFTDGYFDATQALVVQADSGYESLADLEGQQVGVQTGTTGQIYGEDHEEEFGYTLKVFDDIALELNALKAGNVAGAINDNVPILAFVAENPDTVMVEEFDTGEVYGFMAEKDDPNATAMVERFNELLDQARDDGTYDEIYDTWFGAGE